MPEVFIDDTDAEILQGYIAELLDSKNFLGVADIVALQNLLEQLYDLTLTEEAN